MNIVAIPTSNTYKLRQRLIEYGFNAVRSNGGIDTDCTPALLDKLAGDMGCDWTEVIDFEADVDSDELDYLNDGVLHAW